MEAHEKSVAEEVVMLVWVGDMLASCRAWPETALLFRNMQNNDAWKMEKKAPRCA